MGEEKRLTPARLSEMFNERFNKVEQSLQQLSNDFIRIDKGFEKAESTVNCMSHDISEMRKSIIENHVSENKKLQEKFARLEQRFEVMDEDMDESFERLEKVEEITSSTNQYGRRNNIELSGVPNDVDDNNLENKVIDIFKTINIELTNNDIEACHRLPIPKNNRNGNKKVIVRFTNRKFCEKALSLRKKFKDIDVQTLTLTLVQRFLLMKT